MRLSWVVVLGLAAWVGCVGDPQEDTDAGGVLLPDGEDSRAPRFTQALPLVELDPGASQTLSLRDLVEDPDGPEDALRLSAVVSGPGVTARVEGLDLTLEAARGFEGFGSVALRLTDEDGLYDVADLRVKVGDPPIPVEDAGEDGEDGAEDARPEDAREDAPPDDVREDVPPGDVREDPREDAPPDEDTSQPDIEEDPDEDPIGPDPQEPAVRDCRTVFTYDANRFGGGFQSLAVAGEFNNFSTSAAPMRDEDGDGVWSAALDVPEGDYGYKLVKNGGQGEGAWFEDPANPYLKTVGCCDNSRVLVPACQGPALELIEAQTDVDAGELRVELRVWDAPQGRGVDWDTLSVEVNHAPAPRGSVRVLGDRVTLTLAGLDVPNRYTVVATVRDNAGAASDPFYAPLWLEQEAFSWKDAVLYFAFTDRFHDGDPSNNDPTEGVEALANWSGGDFKGIQDKIEAGYFDELGVNALWISAPNDNPNRRDSGADGRGYAAYHGYFPSSWTEPEDHFGDVEDLRAMVAAAHRRGIRVLIDWVGNHVHDEHPWRRDNPDWFNGPGLCRDNDGWNQRPETCWFEPYLPDLRYEVPGVTEAVADAGAWWVQETDLDGFRVDAVKHMPHNFGYTLRARIDSLFKHSNTPFYMVGETFVGDWNVGNGNLLKAYVRPGELDGQFDFPLYWELLKVIGRREGNFRDLERVVAASENFYGPSAIMSSFLGNHDVPRFVSHAWQPPFDLWGNGGRDIGWDPNRRPGQPSEAEPYKRLEQAFAFLMTMPEVPLIYYGDEVGLAGAGDPDNRRVMPAEGALNVHQRALRERVGLLGALRRESGALRRGTRTTLATEDGWYAYQRRLGQEAVVVVLSRDGGSFTVRPSAPVNNGDVLRDAITGNTFTVQGGGVTLQLPANGAAVLVK